METSSLSCMWVRTNSVTSLGIYLVLPVASGWLRLPLCSPAHSGSACFSYEHLDEAARRSSGDDQQRRFFMHGFGSLGLIEYNGKFDDLITGHRC